MTTKQASGVRPSQGKSRPGLIARQCGAAIAVPRTKSRCLSGFFGSRKENVHELPLGSRWQSWCYCGRRYVERESG